MSQDAESAPPAYSPGTAAAPQGGSTSGYGFVNTLKSPWGITRCVEILCAIIMFGTVADVDGFDSFSQFQFCVAMGVLAFMYALAALFVVSSGFLVSIFAPIVEFACDASFSFFTFLAGILTAAKFAKSIQPIEDIAPSKVVNNLRSGAVFAFFTSLAFLFSSIVSFRRWRS